MKTSRFDYHLPVNLIAQHPPRVRRRCRLLKLDRTTGSISHHQFTELPKLLNRHDLLVVNDSEVIPARLLGQRESGGAAEIFLLEKVGRRRWRAMVRPGARLRPGSLITFGQNGSSTFCARIDAQAGEGTRIVQFEGRGRFEDWLEHTGHVPLPPYIKRDDQISDKRDYQTIFARHRGAVAAPTAGLHFDKPLLQKLKDNGISTAPITLHVGPGTFSPVRSDRIEDHVIDGEQYTVSARSMMRIARKHMAAYGRIIAVGTTATRTLETLSGISEWKTLSNTAGRRNKAPRSSSVSGTADLFIRPGYKFQLVGGLITNFHLPRSSLLALVAAFAGLEPVLNAYRVAVNEGYRFYSYGDAMLIL